MVVEQETMPSSSKKNAQEEAAAAAAAAANRFPKRRGLGSNSNKSPASNPSQTSMSFDDLGSAAAAILKLLGGIKQQGGAAKGAFDPDDPSFTPQDMIQARPWLQTPLHGPLRVRYPSAPTSDTCIVVREEGSKKQTVLRVGGWLHTATSLAETEEGLLHPPLLSSLPVLQITLESGICGDFVN